MKPVYEALSLYFTALGLALRSPNLKQKEAYARYSHTLSAAVLIAGGAVPFTSNEFTISVILKAAAASVLAIALFGAGALLLKET